MGPHVKKILQIIIFVAPLAFTQENYYCPQSGNPQFQVAYILDKTASYKPFVSCAKKVSEKVNKFIRDTYKESEFAITIFGDYDYETASPVPIRREGYHSSPENVTVTYPQAAAAACSFEKNIDCYTPLVNFKSTYADFENTFAHLVTDESYASGGSSESSLTALLFTAVDKTMGWKNSTSNINYRKVLILCTDEDTTLDLNKKAGRQTAKLDGTDTCDNNLVPKKNLVGTKLYEHEFMVIVLASQGSFRPNIKGIWETHMAELGLDSLVITCDDNATPKIKEFLEFYSECEAPDPPAYNILGL